MATIALLGDSTSRALYNYMTALMPDYTIYDPVNDGGHANWGYSATFLADIVPLVNALSPDPDLIAVNVSHWSMRHDPLVGSPYDESLAAFNSDMTAGLSSIIANTTTPYIFVMGSVPIDRVSTDQGDAPAPYRFESDAVLFRNEIQSVINSIGDSRLIYYDQTVQIIAQDIQQPDGIHYDSYGEYQMSITYESLFRETLGSQGGSILADTIDLTGLLWGFSPFSAGEGNYNASKNTGNQPTINGLYQNAVMTGFAVGKGFVYSSGDSHLLFDSGDYITPQFAYSYTNTSERTLQIICTVGGAGTNRYIFSTVSGAEFEFFRIGTDNKLRYYILDGVNLREVKSNVPTVPTSGLVQIAYLKYSDGTMELSINGLEPGYSVQNTYNIGNFTPGANTIWGNYNNTNPFNGKIYHIFDYNRVKTHAELLSDYNLGEALGGLIGTVTGDSLLLSYPSATTTPNSNLNLGITLSI